jgi:hypothetical protein
LSQDAPHLKTCNEEEEQHWPENVALFHADDAWERLLHTINVKLNHYLLVPLLT